MKNNKNSNILLKKYLNHRTNNIYNIYSKYEKDIIFKLTLGGILWSNNLGVCFEIKNCSESQKLLFNKNTLSKYLQTLAFLN